MNRIRTVLGFFFLSINFNSYAKGLMDYYSRSIPEMDITFTVSNGYDSKVANCQKLSGIAIAECTLELNQFQYLGLVTIINNTATNITLTYTTPTNVAVEDQSKTTCQQRISLAMGKKCTVGYDAFSLGKTTVNYYASGILIAVVTINVS